MNMLRHIFSFKLVIVFALVAFLGALPKVPDALALVTCPCPYTLIYKASVAYAHSVGFTNKVQRCFDLTDVLTVEGSNGPCGTFMSIDLLTSTPFCTFLFGCGPVEPDPGYIFTVTNATITLTPREVRACRAELLAIAKLSGVLPCQQP